MTTVKQFVQQYSMATDRHSNDNIAQFKQVRSYMASSKTRDTVYKELKEEAKAITLDSTRREFNKLVDNVKAWFDMPDKTVHLGYINFDNLMRVIRLSKYVTKHYDGDMTKLKSLEVYEHGISPHRYNNSLEEAAKALMDGIRVAPQAPDEEAVLKYADTLTVTAKTVLLERLLSDLGYSIEEVA